MKKFQKLFFILCLSLCLPLCAKADYEIGISCTKTDGSACEKDSQSKYKIKVGEKVTIKYVIDANDVGGFQADVSTSSSSIITGPSDFEYSTFFDGTSGFENNKIILSNNRGTGTPSFSYTVTGKGTGNASITLSNIRIIDNNGDDHKITDNKVVNFAVEATSTNNGGTTTPDSENTTTNNGTTTPDSGNTTTNNGTTTSDNGNTTTNNGTTKTDTTNQKTTSDKTTNPKTGVKFPIISCIVLISGSILFAILRKKNYFNKI